MKRQEKQYDYVCGVGRKINLSDGKHVWKFIG